MKRYQPYILGILIATALIFLFVTGNKKANRRIDNKITFRKNDKRPYGMYVAYEHLKYLFPSASLSANKYEPGYWDSLSSYSKDQALIIIADRFSADNFELKRLIKFVENGNDVFISARELSYDAKNIFKCKTIANDVFSYTNNVGMSDSLTVSLMSPPFSNNFNYTYPGRGISSFFEKINDSTTDILGNNEFGSPDFIHLQTGYGNFYIHLAPIAFTNYFLLHKQNIRYYEKAFSLINPSVKRIVWDEYYLNSNTRRSDKDNKKSWLSVLSGFPALKAALITALLCLLVYVLLEMRRKQHYIPVVSKPKNDSMDFVKTIGRLYFDKGNHRNLCKKMGLYFLEFVRNKYKLSTGALDEEFIHNLKVKSGVDEIIIREIVSFIKYLNESGAISPRQVTDFHSQLESFYKKA